jgi:hypothetical protein
MISNAFKGAYTSQVSAQTQGINTISSGVKKSCNTSSRCNWWIREGC